VQGRVTHREDEDVAHSELPHALSAALSSKVANDASRLPSTADSESAGGYDSTVTQKKYANGGFRSHRRASEAYEEKPATIINDERAKASREIHESNSVFFDAGRITWRRDSSSSISSVSHLSGFSAPNAAEDVSLTGVDVGFKASEELLPHKSTLETRPFGLPRRPVSALPRVPRSRYQQRTPIVSPPSTPPCPAHDLSSMLPYPPVHVELQPAQSASVASPLRDGRPSEEHPSWWTMVAMMAGEHPSTSAAIAEAQAGAIQAIIQANYDAFLASNRSAARLSRSWKENYPCERDANYNGDNDEDRRRNDKASAARSEREAFERIFLGQFSESGGSVDRTSRGTPMSTDSGSTRSSRTSSGGTCAAAVNTCTTDREEQSYCA
jgi:hypothetical protein